MRMRGFLICAVAAMSTISNACAGVVCTAVAEASTGAVIVQEGECNRRVTPASTFKIAISLMGYDAGFLKNEHSPVLPYRRGYVDWGANPRQAADPARWIGDSVVWYSQQVTQALGKERFAAYARRFQFGNADVSGDPQHDGLTRSWINSSLRISPLEQLSFLRKVVNRELGVSAHAYDMTNAITRIVDTPSEWEVHGKTGSSGDSGGGWGWYVGWASKGQRTVVFARLIQDEPSLVNATPAGLRARAGVLEELPGLLGPSSR